MGLEGVRYNLEETQNALHDILTAYLETTLEKLRSNPERKIKSATHAIRQGERGHFVEIGYEFESDYDGNGKEFLAALEQAFGTNAYTGAYHAGETAYFQTEGYPTLLKAVKGIAGVNQVGIEAALEEHQTLKFQREEKETATEHDANSAVSKYVHRPFVGVLALYRS